MSIVEVDMPSLMGLRCAVSYDFPDGLVMQTVLPLIGFACLGVPTAVASVVVWLQRKQQSRDAVGETERKSKGRSHGVASETLRYCATAMLSLAFLVYPSVSLALFRYFKCVDTGESRVLLADMTIMCNSGKYRGFPAFTLVMILVYPFGIPTMYLGLLLKLCVESNVHKIA